MGDGFWGRGVPMPTASNDGGASSRKAGRAVYAERIDDGILSRIEARHLDGPLRVIEDPFLAVCGDRSRSLYGHYLSCGHLIYERHGSASNLVRLIASVFRLWLRLRSKYQTLPLPCLPCPICARKVPLAFSNVDAAAVELDGQMMYFYKEIPREDITCSAS